MARFRILAIASAFAFALIGCGGGGGNSGPSASGGGLETVDDAAAIVAHRPTGSQYAATAIGAVDALGSLVRELAPAGGSAWIDHGCRAGSEFLAPSRNGDPRSTETREFFDAGCTELARDSIRSYRPMGGSAETEAVAVSIYTRGGAAPVALRVENSQITNARFDSLGFPIARDGFLQTTTRQLLVSNQRQSVSSSSTAIAPSSGNGVNAICENSAGYDAAGVPSLDATFGWQGSTIESPTSIRRDDGNGSVTVSTAQIGNTFAGPVGSLSLLAGAPRGGCTDAPPGYALTGATVTSAFTVPIRASYRDGKLSSLGIWRASFSSGYRFDLVTTRRANDGIDRGVRGLLTNGKTRVASLSSDAFGSGELTITSTGAEYRIVDWTVVL